MAIPDIGADGAWKVASSFYQGGAHGEVEHPGRTPVHHAMSARSKIGAISATRRVVSLAAGLLHALATGALDEALDGVDRSVHTV